MSRESAKHPAGCLNHKMYLMKKFYPTLENFFLKHGMRVVIYGVAIALFVSIFLFNAKQFFK